MLVEDLIRQCQPKNLSGLICHSVEVFSRAYIYKRRQADFPYDDEYLFLAKERQPITPACIGTLMRRLKLKANIPRLHAHLFRHTYATNFLVHGIGDVYELSRLLGHSDVRITEKYLQLASYYTIIEKRRHVSYLDRKR